MQQIVFLTVSDKFTKGFIQFFKNHFNFEQFLFIVIGNNKYKFQTNDSNIIFVNNNYKLFSLKILKKIIKCKKIIISPVGGSVVLFTSFPFLLSKTYLMFWGSDFYSMRNKEKFLKKPIAVLSSLYKKYVIKRAHGIINLIEEDYDALCEIVVPRGERFVAQVRGDERLNEYILSLYSNNSCNEYTIIQIGNSATPENHHVEAMEMIKGFSEENIKVICPLSYGEEEYCRHVISKGYEYFGDKFEPITSFMGEKEYYEKISKNNIAIFNNDRQQAMGNITTLLGVGCKVFLRSDTSMWQHYSNNYHFAVYDTAEIENMSFDEFIMFSDDNKKKNLTEYQKKRDIAVAIAEWRDVLDMEV